VTRLHDSAGWMMFGRAGAPAHEKRRPSAGAFSGSGGLSRDDARRSR
jgi:hypothetical protein